MPWYGSFNDSSSSEPSIATKQKSKKRKRRTPETYRIPSISRGVAYDINNQPVSANTFGSIMPDVTSEVDLNTASETDGAAKKSYEPHILEKSLERTICYHLRRRKKTSGLVISLLCVLTVTFNTAFLIIGPIYTSSMRKAGGDETVVLLSLSAVLPIPLIILSLILKHTYDKSITLKPSASMAMYAVMGVCQNLRLNMGLFSSHPHKTPHTIQPALSGIVVPFSVILTVMIIRKGLSKTRLTCCVVVLIGVFVSAQPRIWSLEGSEKGDLFFSHDLVKQIVWPVIFCLSYFPLTVYNTLAEKELRKHAIHSFSLSTSGMLSACVFTLFMFWTDFLPWYGNVTNFPHFWETVKSGFTCNFSYAPGCQHCLIKLMVLSVSVSLFNIFSLLLVYVTEGSVFASVVMCVSVPLASAFWTLFHYDYNTDTLTWQPWWSHTTTFLLLSVVILVPTTVAYNHFSIKDAKEMKKEKNGYSDISSSEYEWD